MIFEVFIEWAIKELMPPSKKQLIVDLVFTRIKECFSVFQIHQISLVLKIVLSRYPVLTKFAKWHSRTLKRHTSLRITSKLALLLQREGGQEDL